MTKNKNHDPISRKQRMLWVVHWWSSPTPLFWLSVVVTGLCFIFNTLCASDVCGYWGGSSPLAASSYVSIVQPTRVCLNTHINISWVKVWIKSNKTQKININKSRITRYFLCSLVSSVQAQVLSANTRDMQTFVLVKTLCGHYRQTSAPGRWFKGSGALSSKTDAIIDRSKSGSLGPVRKMLNETEIDLL